MSKSTRIFVVVFIILRAMDSASAGAYGLGKESCAKFGELYKLNPTQAEDLFFTWAQGFISGLDLETELQAGMTRLPDGGSLPLEPIKLQIRAYCDAHPLAPYYSSVTKVYMSLPAKAVGAK